MPAFLFVEAFGQMAGEPDIDAPEEDLYSVFRDRSILMGWYSETSDQYPVSLAPMLWAMEEAEMTADTDTRRIGWVQVGISVGELERAKPSPGPVQGFAYAPLPVHRRDIEPSVVLPALIQCFVDALHRFGIVELSGIQVSARSLEPKAQPYSRSLNSGRSWFNTNLKGRADALIAFDEEFLGEHTEAELLAGLQRKYTGTFQFGPVVIVPEQYSIKAGDEYAIRCISPAGFGISVAMPEWTPNAVGWALGSVIDSARIINPDARNFTVRLTRI